MKLLEKLFSNENFKKSIFSKLAKQAKEQGINKLLITLKEDGSFDTEACGENHLVVDKKTYDFLLNFYNKNKGMPDTIKP